MDQIELLVSEQLTACTFASVSLRVTARAAQTFASVAHDILMMGEEVFRAIDIEMRTRLFNRARGTAYELTLFAYILACSSPRASES